jgi:hypothetical protein
MRQRSRLAMARECSPAPPLTKIRSLFDPGWERSRCDARDTAQLLDAFRHDEGSVGCEKEGGQEVGGVGPFNGFLSAPHLVPPFLDVKDHFPIAIKEGTRLEVAVYGLRKIMSFIMR